MVEADLHQEQQRDPNWENPLWTQKWLQARLIDATEGIDCIDERKKVKEAVILQKLGDNPNEPTFKDFVPNDGALNFPGMDAGLALMLIKGLSIHPAEAVHIIKGYAVESGREGLHVHTDIDHVTENTESGCGVMQLLAHNADVLGINKQQGRDLVSAILNEAVREDGGVHVATYEGSHKPKAWVINMSEEKRFDNMMMKAITSF